MSDLFISYSSHDRSWAQRLHDDLREKYPTIKVFWDHESLRPGANYRAVLDDEMRHSDHFAVLWSDAAKQSNEVGPEIQAFRADVDRRPGESGSKRTLFYIPLQGAYGDLEQQQGFVDFRTLHAYDPALPDRGVSSVDRDPVRPEWNRLIRHIGETVLRVRTTQPVTLAVLCMDQELAQRVGPVAGFRTGPGPSLEEFLTGIGLTVAQVTPRYGINAFAWHPFGTAQTVIDFMEDLRQETNRLLKPEYWYHYVPVDLLAMSLQTTTVDDLTARLDALAESASIVVIDHISLYSQVVANIFALLPTYAAKPQSVIMTLAPKLVPEASFMYESVRTISISVLKQYFVPQIPAAGGFAMCGVNLQNKLELLRLIRMSLGSHQVKQKGDKDKPITSMGSGS
jgi:hypothetical protein